MEVVLKFGDGFFGRDYRLFVGTLVYVLKDNCGGSDYDEIEARGKAVRILEEMAVWFSDMSHSGQEIYRGAKRNELERVVRRERRHKWIEQSLK